MDDLIPECTQDHKLPEEDRLMPHAKLALSPLESRLLTAGDDLRGSIDASEYKQSR